MQSLCSDPFRNLLVKFEEIRLLIFMSFFVAKDDNSEGTGLAADSTAAAEEACGPLLAVAAVGTRVSELPQEDTFLSDPNVRLY